VLALTFPPAIFLIGIVTGLVYGLVAAGLVLIYRCTGVVNFAYGALGSLCAGVLAKLVLTFHFNYLLVLLLVTVMGGVLGALMEFTVIRRLFHAPRIVVLIATIGLAQLFYFLELILPLGTSTFRFPVPFNRQLSIDGVVFNGGDFLALALVPTIVIVLAIFLTRTPMGMAMRASAENPDAAELAGISVKRISTYVWSLGGALAAITVVLYNPIRGVLVGLPQDPFGPGILLPSLAAALVGRMTSLPWALAGGLGMGVIESFINVNTSNGGTADAIFFVLILVLLLVRKADVGGAQSEALVAIPRPRPIPAVLLQRRLFRNIPRLGTAAILALAICLPLVITGSSDLFGVSRVLLYAVAAISTTVLVGWCGQLSLGQFAFVGLGSVLTGTFEAHGLSFASSVGFATILGALAGVLVGAPALRIRGLMLPVTTFAFAVAASTWFFPLPFISGSGGSLSTPPGTFFGINLANERNYYYLCLAVLVLLAAGVSHWRKTGVGRMIIAVRENQERAESLTVSPALVKLSVFAFTAGVAALSGGLLAGLRVNFDISSFGATLSLQILAIVIIGGLGTVSGAIIGTVYVIGLPALLGSSTEVVLLTSGVGLLVLLLYLPGGLISVVYSARDAAYAWLAGRIGEEATPAQAAPPPVKRPFPASAAPAAPAATTVAGPVLVACDVTVALGGRTILDSVSLTADQGETVGLIGANGAGKSTLMNALSGFVRISGGAIDVFGIDVSHNSAHQRARSGMGRIFQDARLFGDLTVNEAIKVALESRQHSEFIPSLLSLPPSRRAERRKESESTEIIAFLGLGRYADSPIATLSTGTRRIVELSCLIAQDAKLLLLDEPTAGIAQREVEAFAPLVVRISRELGATVLIIEHDLPLVSAISDRMYCMSLGTMIAEGTPEQVSHDPAVIAAYLGTDERIIRRSGTLGQRNGSASSAGAVPRTAEGVA
jgi:ABC-type branched-subunit amino acid transport system ATPase component/ABC-type branched-subunit amino acid transport system permease subunit